MPTSAAIRFRPFGAARRFARSLGFARFSEWIAYVRGDRPDLPPLPADIPRSPWISYEGKGWRGYSNWIGTKTARWRCGTLRKRTYRRVLHRAWASYAEASAHAANLGIASAEEWKRYASGADDRGPCPSNLPSNPQFVYRALWTSWGDFLQTGTRSPALIHAEFLPFAEARRLVRTLCLLSSTEWCLYIDGKLPVIGTPMRHLPRDPSKAYRNEGWQGWDDFLGAQYADFAEAAKIVQRLGLKTERSFLAAKKGHLRRELRNVPCDLRGHYGCNWRCSRFFGWAPYENCAALAQEIGVASPRAWQDFVMGKGARSKRCPQNIPLHPHLVYQGDGWISWNHFFNRMPEVVVA